MQLNNKEMQTHTVLTFELDNVFYVFESSYKKYIGLYSFKDFNDFIDNYVKKKFKADSKFVKGLIVLEFKQFNKYNLTTLEYMNKIFEIGNVVYKEGNLTELYYCKDNYWKEESILLKTIENDNDSLLNESFEGNPNDIINSYKEKISNINKKFNENLIARISFHNKTKGFYQKFQKEDNVRENPSIKEFLNENTYLFSDIHFGKHLNEDRKTLMFINKIPEDANLLIAGDIGYVKQPNRTYLKEMFNKIKCKNRYLILGNHDAFPLDFYYDELGFKGVYEYIIDKERKWLITHQPMDCEFGDNYTNLCGHIHDSTTFFNVKKADNKINVFYKYFNKPMKIKEILLEDENHPKEKLIENISF